MESPELVRIRELLTSSISSLCQGSINYDSEITVEGLLGITVDRKDIFLININEIVKNPLAIEPEPPVLERENEIEIEPVTHGRVDIHTPMSQLRAVLEARQNSSETNAVSNSRKGKRKAQPHKISHEIPMEPVFSNADMKKFKPDINNTAVAVLNPEAFADVEADVVEEEEVENVIGTLQIKSEPLDPDDDLARADDGSGEAWLSGHLSMEDHEGSHDSSNISCDQNGDSIKSETFDDSDAASTSLNESGVMSADASIGRIRLVGLHYHFFPMCHIFLCRDMFL
jgi:hypothetical protein